jgi:hypothetical protein
MEEKAMKDLDVKIMLSENLKDNACPLPLAGSPQNSSC